MRIPNEILKGFLEKIQSKIIYNYSTYETNIKFNNLPLGFTLKYIKDNYILSTKKTLPIPLNKKMDVFFYDRTIYVPNNNQLFYYNVLYKNLKKDGKINFGNNINLQILNLLVLKLNDISDTLIMDSEIQNKLEENIKIEFNFEKMEEKYFCNVNLLFNDQLIEYGKAKSSKIELVRNSKKLSIVERELNKNRFFLRDGKFIFLGNDDEYYKFLKEGLNTLNNIGSIDSKKLSKYFNLKSGKLINIFLKEDEKNDIFLSFQLNEINDNELEHILNGYNNKKTYIKLKDGSFVDLKDNEQLIKLMNITDFFNINIKENSDKHLINVNKLYYLNNIVENSEIKLINGKDILNNITKKLYQLNNNKFQIPKEFNGSLREYQIKGYNWLKTISYLEFGGILADEMGLGKTIQIIAFLLSEPLKRTLVVVPTSLIYNWKSEFEKFAPTLKVAIMHASKEKRIKLFNNIEKYNIILTTYGTISNDYLGYNNLKFDYLIIDEGQNISNPKAEITNILKRVNSKSRFVLTGTPIENNLVDLWSLFDFIMPGYLLTERKFTQKFIQENNESLNELKILIEPYILRRTKKDVVEELPNKYEQKIILNMTKEQKKLYNGLL